MTPQTSTVGLLKPQPPVGEEARVEAVLTKVQESFGFVPDGLRLYSISPPLLETFVATVSYFHDESQLPPALLAMIRYLVSWRADCQFCVDLNEGFLTHMGYELEVIRAMRTDPEQAPLEEKEKMLLRLALMAVFKPAQIDHDTLEKARQAGWSDRAIFDTVAQAVSNQTFNLMLHSFKVDH